jgi:hypothetical protein
MSVSKKPEGTTTEFTLTVIICYIKLHAQEYKITNSELVSKKSKGCEGIYFTQLDCIYQN